MDGEPAAPRTGSRLDSFIRRLQAQRACLDWAVAAIADVPGAVVELGLGNGRTYDHLRARLAGSREIFAFDRQLAAHPACIPDVDHLVLGDFRETLPSFATRHPAGIALAHADTGSGDAAATAALARWLGPVLGPMLAPRAIVLSDQPLEIARAAPQPLPPGVPPGRYFVYRAA
jgi:hypothetical protein